MSCTVRSSILWATWYVDLNQNSLVDIKSLTVVQILPRTPEVESPEAMRQFEYAFLKSSIVICIVVIWAADVFLRVVDTPCVHLARRIEKAFFQD